MSLLVTSLGLGLLASRGAVDANLHAMVGFITAALALVSHIRSGGVVDFLAVVGIVTAVGLGLMVQGGGVNAHLHLALALPAATFSAGLHVQRGVKAGRGRAAADDGRCGMKCREFSFFVEPYVSVRTSCAASTASGWRSPRARAAASAAGRDIFDDVFRRPGLERPA